MKATLLAPVAILAVLACPGVLAAQAPVVNIDPERHGNLSAAQEYIVMSWQRINRAQQANNDQLGGHVQKAKELLEQADAELRAAADVANANRYKE